MRPQVELPPPTAEHQRVIGKIAAGTATEADHADHLRFHRERMAKAFGGKGIGDNQSSPATRELLEQLVARAADLHADNTRLIADIAKLIVTIKEPRTRTGEVHLPSGKVSMTITERHGQG